MPEANHGLDEDELEVTAYADEGPTLSAGSRVPAAGSTRIKKRTCHVTLVLAERPESATPRRRERSAATEEQAAPEAAAKTKASTRRKKKEAVA